MPEKIKLNYRKQKSITRPTEVKAILDGTIAKPGKEPILKAGKPDAGEDQTELPGAEGSGSPEGIPAEDVPGTGEERPTGSHRPPHVGGVHKPTARVSGESETPLQPGGRTGARTGIPSKRTGSAAPGRRPQRSGSDVSGDYQLTDADHIGEGRPQAKAEANIAAIRVLKLCEAEKRPATPEEQAVLAKYTGWGASELAKCFEKHAYAIPDAMRPIRAALDELLTAEEFAAARASTVNAHYNRTPS